MPTSKKKYIVARCHPLDGFRMFHDLKSLLGDALSRNRIVRQVTSAQVVEIASGIIAGLLPPGRSEDAVVTSLREGTITVVCRSAAASQLVSRQSDGILDAIKRQAPSADVRAIRTMVGMPRRSSDVL